MVQRIGVACILVLACAWATAYAQPSTRKIYLPTVVQPPGPPPRIDSQLLQRADLPTNYSPNASQSGVIDNATEANTYADSAAALAAFAVQGRETGYAVAFSSQAAAAEGALAVYNKVARYGTSAGASLGQGYARGESLTQGYEPITVPELVDYTVGLRRFVADQTIPGSRLVQYLVAIQRGRYVSTVVVTGRETALDLDEALVFARKAAARLTDGASSAATAP